MVDCKMDLSRYIYIKKDALPKSFCFNVIEKFEQDDRKTQGVVGSGINFDMKRSLDMNISSYQDWDSFDLAFFKNLNTELESYRNFLPEIFKISNTGPKLTGDDTGYQIQRTQPGDFYDWHHDYMGTRIFTFIWYLNDIKEGGYTEFLDGTKIQPETGKLVIFPATWMYVHRGVTPVNETKYICTGWVHMVEGSKPTHNLTIPNKNSGKESEVHQQGM